MQLRLCMLAMLIPLFVIGLAAQSESPQQVQAPQSVTQGLLIHKVQPIYPEAARQARVQGTVVLNAVIDKDGSIKGLTVTSGHPMLVPAAMDAVKQWRYKPYYLNGEPVLVETTINVNFQLSGSPSEAQPNEPAGSGSASSATSNPPEDGLKVYTSCDLGPDFQIAQVDGPVTNFAWPTSTKDGEVRIPVEVGYRVLISYQVEELFGNLKIERLPKSQYSDAKANLLSSQEYLSTDPSMEPEVETVTRNGLTMYGTTRDKLEGGTLSIYYLFLDDENVLVSMYLLNAEPRWRLFNTLEEYKKIRDLFLNVYTKCVATAQKAAPTMNVARSEALPHEPAANSSAASSGSSGPPQTPQAGQSVASDQHSGAYRVGGDVSAPKLVYGPDPNYSDMARQAEYQGTVVLWLVVNADGLPQEIRVQRSLGMGLDEEAIKAVERWRFQPATKDGKPVPVMINVEVNFRLFAFAPPPLIQQNPLRFAGADALTYPLVVRLTSDSKATITEAGKERQVSLSCKPEVRICGHAISGAYPARWIDDKKDHVEILGLEDGRSGPWIKLEYTVAEASLANNGPDRAKGISLHMLPKRVADLGPSEWGLVVSHSGGWKPPQKPPVFQTTQGLLRFVRAQSQEVQENGVWIVVTDPDTYSHAEKTFLEEIKALCRKEKIPLFICRGMNLPNGWKRYNE